MTISPEKGWPLCIAVPLAVCPPAIDLIETLGVADKPQGVLPWVSYPLSGRVPCSPLTSCIYVLSRSPEISLTFRYRLSDVSGGI
jgi:hypothetical protein